MAERIQHIENGWPATEDEYGGETGGILSGRLVSLELLTGGRACAKTTWGKGV